MRQPIEKFGRTAIALHWLIAAGVALAVAFGLGAVYIDDTVTSRGAQAVHQTIGFVILLMAIGRSYWRATHLPPPPPKGMARGQRIAAAITHLTLYLFLFLMPISGYVALAARGRSITVFGLFDLPLVAPRSFELAAGALALHSYAQYALYALIASHVGAALYHHFVVKDETLRRMLPGGARAAP